MPRKTKNKKESVATKKLEASVYDLKGQAAGRVSLPPEIFAAKINPVLLAQAVRVYRVNQRAGTAASKTRSQITGSTRKIYRQKGTGRARHGDIKAPIFIGGGVAHGPKPVDYHLSLPVKMKRLALFASLTDKFQNNGIRFISGFSSIDAKTRNIISVLKNLSLTQKNGNLFHKTLLVLPESLKNIYLAGRNVENFHMREAKLLNTYDIIASQNILFMKEAVQILEDHLINKKARDVTDATVEPRQKKKSEKPQKKPAKIIKAQTKRKSKKVKS